MKENYELTEFHAIYVHIYAMKIIRDIFVEHRGTQKPVKRNTAFPPCESMMVNFTKAQKGTDVKLSSKCFRVVIKKKH